MIDIKFCSKFSKYMNDFISMREKSLKKATTRVSKLQLKSFDDFIKKGKFSNISKELLDLWIASLKGSESTISHYICTVRLFIEYLSKLGFDVYIPNIPKVHKTYMPYIYSNEEINRIIDFADSYYYSYRNHTSKLLSVQLAIIIRIALCTGMRISEIVSLKIKNHNIKERILSIETGKNNKQRLIPIDDALSNILYKYCILTNNIKNQNSWMFPSENKSKHISNQQISARFAYVLKKLSIYHISNKFERGQCFHCLRHTFVINSFKKLDELGIKTDNSIPYLSIYLGHNSLRETEHYMNFTTDMFIDKIKKYSNSINVFPEVTYEEQ